MVLVLGFQDNCTVCCTAVGVVGVVGVEGVVGVGEVGCVGVVVVGGAGDGAVVVGLTPSPASANDAGEERFALRMETVPVAAPFT